MLSKLLNSKYTTFFDKLNPNQSIAEQAYRKLLITQTLTIFDGFSEKLYMHFEEKRIIAEIFGAIHNCILTIFHESVARLRNEVTPQNFVLIEKNFKDIINSNYLDRLRIEFSEYEKNTRNSKIDFVYFIYAFLEGLSKTNINIEWINQKFPRKDRRKISKDLTLYFEKFNQSVFDALTNMPILSMQYEMVAEMLVEKEHYKDEVILNSLWTLYKIENFQHTSKQQIFNYSEISKQIFYAIANNITNYDQLFVKNNLLTAALVTLDQLMKDLLKSKLNTPEILQSCKQIAEIIHNDLLNGDNPNKLNIAFNVLLSFDLGEYANELKSAFSQIQEGIIFRAEIGCLNNLLLLMVVTKTYEVTMVPNNDSDMLRKIDPYIFMITSLYVSSNAADDVPFFLGEYYIHFCQPQQYNIVWLNGFKNLAQKPHFNLEIATKVLAEKAMTCMIQLLMRATGNSMICMTSPDPETDFTTFCRNELKILLQPTPELNTHSSFSSVNTSMATTPAYSNSLRKSPSNMNLLELDIPYYKMANNARLD